MSRSAKAIARSSEDKDSYRNEDNDEDMDDKDVALLRHEGCARPRIAYAFIIVTFIAYWVA